VGRPPNHVRRLYGDFEYQAASWDEPRRVVAKVEWHPGELFPRVGFVVTNLPMDPDWIIRFYNQRGTAEQHIKEGKQAINWTRLSCKALMKSAAGHDAGKPHKVAIMAVARKLVTIANALCKVRQKWTVQPAWRIRLLELWKKVIG